MSDLHAAQQLIRKSMAKDQIESWLQPHTARVYRDLALDWTGILGSLIAVAWLKTWWIYGISFLAIGFCQYALFILGHDALHNSLHPNRAVNDQLARWLVYGGMFMGMEDARRNHLEHHRNLGTELDPDRYLHALSHKNSKTDFFLFCSGLATFGKTLFKVTPLGKIMRQSAEDRAPNSVKPKASKILADYFQQRLSVLVMQLLLISLFALLGLPWWSYLLLWVAPIYFCVFLPDELRAFCDHAVPMLSDRQADHLRLVTFRPSWLEAIIFSPHNMNYHTEHHLLPTVPYYNLPKVHQFTKSRAEVTVRSSYFAFLFQIFAVLPLQPQAELAPAERKEQENG